MKSYLLLLSLVLPCFGGETSFDVSEAAVASGTVTLCETMPNNTGPLGPAECQKRDTARLFLIAGKPGAALRLLCDTQVARTAFGDDYEAEHHQWVHPVIPAKCLQAIGISTGQGRP